MTKDNNTTQMRAIPSKDIVSMAMDAGFMLSTGYGQQANKQMPVSDVDTLKAFARLVIEYSQPQSVSEGDVERVARAIEETMFNPHELPLDDELHSKFLITADAAIAAMNADHFRDATKKVGAETGGVE